MFKLWCANVRFNMYTQTRGKLERRLFMGKKSFVPYLVKINALTHEANVIQLMNIKQQKYESSEFAKDQV